MYVIASIFGGYIASSLILFKFPNLIHKKKKLKFLCQHISHRGGAGEFLENTIVAFENAVRKGTDMLEIDLHLTKDGKVVVSHDDNLHRVTGVNVKISDLCYKDLPLLKNDLPKGELITNESEHKIPLLEDVFTKFPEMPINIDIKVNNDTLISKVNELIVEYKRENITVWGNFSNEVTQKCYNLNPNIPIYFSARRVIFLVFITYNGLLPFIPLKESCLELLMPSIVLKNPSMMISRDKFWSRYMVWLIDKLLMRKALFEHLSKRGIQTYFWVLNEEEDFKRAFELGATGIMTDYPTKLRKFLDNNSVESKSKLNVGKKVLSEVFLILPNKGVEDRNFLLTSGSRIYMAGYSSKHFLSLTIPSVLGLSIIWFLRRRSGFKKKIEAIESDNLDQLSAFYPSKLKAQEACSIEENASAKMQLKDTESGAETQLMTSSNGTAQIPKVKGKGDDMARLCENGTSCSMGEPITNDSRKGSAQSRRSDSKIEITNGMIVVHLNGESSLKESHANGSCKNGEIENLSNTNNVIKHIDDSIAFGKDNSKALKTDEVNKSYLPEENNLTDSGKDQLTDNHVSDVCNGFSSMSVDTLTINEKSLNVNGDSKEENNTKISSLKSECDVPDSDELYLPDDTSKSLNGQCIISLNAADSSASSVISTMSDDENPKSPLSILTDDDQLTSADFVEADGNTELLTLPIDDTGVTTQTEMLESPGATYCDSLGSNDSGRGASEIQFKVSEDQVVYMVYEFEILPENCGRLIGRLGRNVKYINKQTNASIVIKKHPCCKEKRLCTITGTESEINAALKLIRKRFPIEHYPSVTLAQINSIPISTLLCPETLKLSLPEGGVFEALLCSTVNAGHFFLQQPTHPTFYQLPPLTNAMNALYGQTETPLLDEPTRGNICAAEIAGGWYRAEIDEVYEESDNCRLKFLDYGGYADVPKASIRKIKCDFMLIPFQATECYLAGVMPLGENGWSEEAISSFEQDAQGQLIQGCIVAYAENRIPYVNLYKITGAESVFINQKLVDDGFARSIPLPALE
ncbi:hypothetical protein JTE90_004645 [Oedothorax gibbosus]|uniref:Uncharacterized protein n=1 Tax=Oedothorax gibbosus TaxID=931172 RepID=A0AAV6UYX5_9ARAC|nr:hypothetical protein JTE90_004645 [Oedothorax gibbosus]